MYELKFHFNKIIHFNQYTLLSLCFECSINLVRYILGALNVYMKSMLSNLKTKASHLNLAVEGIAIQLQSSLFLYEDVKHRHA